ncbi:DUF1254 domain-containing protein (plasmid) [Sinorhizobium medicae]|nr:DUF1254 domain-containing protein [Sinorhizobium medicae]
MRTRSPTGGRNPQTTSWPPSNVSARKSRTYDTNFSDDYVFAWFDLTKGPIVIDYPEGATAGSLIDWWDCPLIDVGVSGPDGGKGVKLVLVGPAHEAPENSPVGAKLLRSRTNKVLMFCRGLDGDLTKVEAVGCLPWR